MRGLSFVFFAAVLVFICEGKVFTRCRLATELLKTKIISKTFLGSWVCLIEQVSNRNTKAYTVTTGGKKLYGLYQIPQKFCREGKRGGLCNVACESLLDDDIQDDTACANYIFELEGFKFWTIWTTRCKKNDHVTTEIYKCPDLTSQRSSPEVPSPALEDLDRNMSYFLLKYRRYQRRAAKLLRIPLEYEEPDELLV